ncbi:hypothetical protein Q2941_12310 [Bradyrhizobium sp. UFLA05-153]
MSFSLDGRVKRLEGQVYTLTAAPVITDASKTPATPAVSSGAVQNPIAETCAKLAIEAAASIKAGHSSTEAEPIQEMMQKLGCSK